MSLVLDLPATVRPAPSAGDGGAQALARAAVALALAWCAAFPLLGLGFRLNLFADGSLFSYAVAAGDSWAFHWRNISGRAFAWTLTFLPAELWVRLADDPAGGVRIYAALHFLAPAASLALAFAVDRTPGRAVFRWAAVSTALLLPAVFGFPTELWIAHAAFWPALALVLTPGGAGRWAATALALAALCLSHEGGAVWAVAAACASALRPRPLRALAEAASALAAALAPWAAIKTLIRPEPYVAEALARNAVDFLDPLALAAPVVLLAAATLGAYGLGLFAFRRSPRPALAATAAVGALLALWWIALDGALHAWSRYDLRTLLFGAVPVLGLLGALDATGRGATLVARAPGRLWPALGGALALLSLIHAVETAKFARAFDGYLTAVEALATGVAADPELGDPAFVSAGRIGPAQGLLGWHSTTPFLSVMTAPGLAPERLVVDPRTNYFWLSCETATASADARRALPARSRALIRDYSCLRRPAGS